MKTSEVLLIALASGMVVCAVFLFGLEVFGSPQIVPAERRPGEVLGGRWVQRENGEVWFYPDTRGVTWTGDWDPTRPMKVMEAR